MKLTLDTFLDLALVVWIALAAAQHLALAVPASWGSLNPALQPDWRVGYLVVGALLLAGIVARAIRPGGRS